MLICYICDRFIETNSYKTNILVGNRYTPEATIILQLLKLMQMERVAGGVLRYSPLIKIIPQRCNMQQVKGNLA
jgi:hypothetical protein